MLKKYGGGCLILYCFLTPVFFSAGCKNYLCASHQILAAIVHVGIDKIDSLVYRRYKANDSYQTLIDTVLVVNAARHGGVGNAVFTTENDSAFVIYVNGDSSVNGISAGYDWQIFIPAMDTTFYIYNLVSPQLDGSEACDNALLAYTQDSLVISSPFFSATGEQYTNGYWIYLQP